MMLTKDDNDSYLRHLCVVKNNYMPEKDKNRSYVIRFNDHLAFEATGDRVDFDDLDNPEYLGKAKELLADGKSYREISEALNQMGFMVSKSTLQRKLK